jgi:hypothetical protein
MAGGLRSSTRSTSMVSGHHAAGIAMVSISSTKETASREAVSCHALTPDRPDQL